MRSATKGICILAMVALISASSCGPDSKKTVVFIFCDVTHSLNKSESDQVAAMAVRIVNSLPPGTEYKMYPILAETNHLAPINKDNEWVIRQKEKNAGLQEVRDKRRGEEITQELAKLYKETNASPGRRRDDRRTCILNAINFAGSQFKLFPADKYDRELILISDMLEECNDTPLSRPIDIHKHDITQEIQLAKGFPEGTDLSGVKVNIITPVTEDTYIREDDGMRPPPNALKEFWNTIFSRCNVTTEAQNNAAMYLWSDGDLPESLFAHS